ncbi:RNA polymerase sigma factor [Butyrivibrio sp. WCD2001]|uniref:RNA polymerase sigma factor n=1 Tax=Butyrivibrio sp. WCD2001 TaxID=1280681 RepID=UPI0003F5D671|nr:RNA polymerase sigma factor [Butyrivibrio sp. WCD2001]
MKTSEELQQLVAELQNGNRDSFNEIYEDSYKYLYTCVIHIVKNEEIAKDVLQETYTEIYKSIGQLKNPKDFLSWASTIANRKAFALLKKKNRDILVLEDANESDCDFFDDLPDDENIIPENIIDNREKIMMIREMIDGLTDVQRACLIGFYYNGQKQDEIAEELGIPVNTVKSHLNRAKAKIKEAVGDVEKKQGIKLYSFAPFMLYFFRKEMELFAADITVPAMSASLSSAIASHAVGGIGKKVAVFSAKTKFIAGATTTAVVVGAVAGTIAYNNRATNYVDVRIEPSVLVQDIKVYDMDLEDLSYEKILGHMEDIEAQYNAKAEPEYYIEYDGSNYQLESYDGPVSGANIAHKKSWMAENMRFSKWEYNDGIDMKEHKSDFMQDYFLTGRSEEEWTPLYENCKYEKNIVNNTSGLTFDSLTVEDNEERFLWTKYSDEKEYINIQDIRDENESIKLNPGSYVPVGEYIMCGYIGNNIEEVTNSLYPGLYELTLSNETVDFQNGTVQYVESETRDENWRYGEVTYTDKTLRNIIIKFSDSTKEDFHTIQFVSDNDDGTITKVYLHKSS